MNLAIRNKLSSHSTTSVQNHSQKIHKKSCKNRTEKWFAAGAYEGYSFKRWTTLHICQWKITTSSPFFFKYHLKSELSPGVGGGISSFRGEGRDTSQQLKFYRKLIFSIHRFLSSETSKTIEILTFFWEVRDTLNFAKLRIFPEVSKTLNFQFNRGPAGVVHGGGMLLHPWIIFKFARNCPKHLHNWKS